MAADELYHERQRLQLCLLHALNNLLQASRRAEIDRSSSLPAQGEESSKLFTRKELDAIADGLGDSGGGGAWLWWRRHQHRNVLGNYDANVLLAALATRGMDAAWYDKRRGGTAGFLLGGGDQAAPLVGVIVNVSAVRFLGLWKGRHWIAVKRHGGSWYNLDSDLAAPLSLGGEKAAVEFLDKLLADGGELFLVTKRSRQD